MTDTSVMVDIPAVVLTAVIDTVRSLNETNPTSGTLITAMTEAVDRWVCDLATEHHFSRRFTINTPTEPFAAAFAEIIAAVRYLQSAGNRTITVAAAFEEALTEWLIDINDDRGTIPSAPASVLPSTTALPRAEPALIEPPPASPPVQPGPAAPPPTTGICFESPSAHVDAGRLRSPAPTRKGDAYGATPQAAQVVMMPRVVVPTPKFVLSVFASPVPVVVPALNEPSKVDRAGWVVAFVLEAAAGARHTTNLAEMIGVTAKTVDNNTGANNPLIEKIDGVVSLVEAAMSDYQLMASLAHVVESDETDTDSAEAAFQQLISEFAKVQGRAYGGTPAKVWAWVDEFPGEGAASARSLATASVLHSIGIVGAAWRRRTPVASAQRMVRAMLGAIRALEVQEPWEALAGVACVATFAPAESLGLVNTALTHRFARGEVAPGWLVDLVQGVEQ